MLKLFTLLAIATTGVVRSCDVSVPTELLNGCAFNTLVLVEPENSFVLNQDNCGCNIPMDNFGGSPLVFYDEVEEEEAEYTLIMIDADVPELENGEVYLHWMRSNILGRDLKNGMGFNTGDDFIEYEGPQSTLSAGLHHYTFYLYEQRVNEALIQVPEERSKFDLNDWIVSTQPAGALCGPIASMEFQIEY